MKRIAGITLMTIAAGAALGLAAAPASAAGHDGYPGYEYKHSTPHHGGYGHGGHGHGGHGHGHGHGGHGHGHGYY